MEVKEFLKKVINSPQYKGWKQEKQETYLAHVFAMVGEKDIVDLQAGFYDVMSRTITSFVISDNNVKMISEDDVFKKPDDSHVKQLNIENVNVDLNDALDKTLNLLDEKYKANTLKRFLILQSLDEGQVWNATVLTNKFTTINVKIDSTSGSIISDKEINIIDMEKSH